MHSGTKYMGGHSDVLLGIATASPFTEQGRRLGPLIRQTQIMVGGVASAMDSWLTLRGLRTLHVRVQRQCRTALELARYLEREKNKEASLVTAVHYPGLESHPKHHVAKRQMKNGGYGGVLSVELNSEHVAMAFAGAMRTMHRATSLGGTETLIEHRASIEPEGRVVSPPGLLRISVGLENATDLIQDVDRALLITKQVQEEMS
jgi:cystathionine gamma-synthase